MKDIPCTPGARRVKAWVAKGEHQQQDFKYAVGDAIKIARSVSAFANRDGGRLLIGVKDNGTIAGVRNEEDAYVVETAAALYCRPAVPVSFHAYGVAAGVTVISAEIAAAGVRPVYVAEADGSLRAYWRVADENIAAHPLMVSAWEMRATGTPLLLDDGHAALLEHIRHCGSICADVRAVALAMHITGRRAAGLITELAAAGTVRFDYRHGSFFLTPSLPDETPDIRHS